MRPRISIHTGKATTIHKYWVRFERLVSESKNKNLVLLQNEYVKGS